MIKHSPILSAVWSRAEVVCDKPALIWNEVTVPYAQLCQRIEAVAQCLWEKGCNAGD